MNVDNLMQTNNTTPEQQAMLDLLEAKRKEFGSVSKWLQWRRENEPGFTEIVEYNPPLSQPVKN